jgi:hypothetical protein
MTKPSTTYCPRAFKMPTKKPAAALQTQPIPDDE